MGQSTPINKAPAPVRHYLVGRDVEGHWVVRDEAGLTGGWFVDKKAAIHFACFETNHRQPIEELTVWALDHHDSIMVARQSFDASENS